MNFRGDQWQNYNLFLHLNELTGEPDKFTVVKLCDDYDDDEREIVNQGKKTLLLLICLEKRNLFFI